MTRQGWKGFVLAGLLGLTGLAAGCSKRDVHEGARQTGQELHKAANEVEDATRNASEGFREGWRGSGTDKDVGDGKIGNNKGVINDGEGPFEQHDQRGDHNVLKDGQGPLEENH